MLALLLTALALPVPIDLAPPATPPDSLEEFLRRARREKAERLARLSQPVADMVAELERRGRAAKGRELERLRRELDALGVEAALLLLPHIDPGATSNGATQFRAEEVASALIRMKTAAITEPLIEMAKDVRSPTHLQAIRILGHAPDHERASKFLVELFRRTTGQTRQEAVAALSRLGGEANTAVLAEALVDENPAVVGVVLEALAQAGAQKSVTGVRDLIRGKMRGAPVVTQVLAYFSACPEVVNQDVAVELLTFAASPAVVRNKRIEILQAIPPFDPNLDARLRSAIEPLLTSADADIVEEAQICLALLGDRNVRRDLKRKYEEWIREQRGWHTAFEKRGQVLLKLEEYADAAKDFKRAIDARQQRGQSVSRELHIDLARAHALGGKLRQAHETLKNAYLSRTQLRQVAEDPDFAELVEHSRYGKLFE